jgi:hypothetical protein
MYAIVPVKNGLPQVGKRHLYNGVSFNQTEAFVEIDGNILEDGWRGLSELEFIGQVYNSGYIHVDKDVIQADGIDEATITIEVMEGITEVNLYSNDVLINIISIDPQTNIGNIKITAVEQGKIDLVVGSYKKGGVSIRCE